ncbi:MAG: hypothetical protein JSS43_32170 [Proteobacteria bacterium]|nr:hypothetical protein [Pseudomonadota bacterium]
MAETLPATEQTGGAAWSLGRHKLGWLATAAVAVAAPGAAEAGYTPPAGVTSYRLMFVSHDIYSQPGGQLYPTSTDIATYDAFVTAQAAQNASLPSTTWSALASTEAVDARDHVSCGAVCDASVPIYLIDGTTRVANTTNALFDTANNELLKSPSEDQFGSFTQIYAWTGSNSDGTVYVGGELGNPLTTMTGYSDFTGEGYIYALLGFPSDQFGYSFYGISDPIEVSIPEPIGSAAFVLGGIAVTRVLRRRRRLDA